MRCLRCDEMANRTNRTPETIEQFLEGLATTASVTAACEIAKIGRTSAYAWRDADPAFAAAWEAALVRGTDALEDEAIRRARLGVDEPVFYQGDECGTVTKYSDTLLIFMLKARRPEVFREQIAVTHTVNVVDRLGSAIARAMQADVGDKPSVH